MVVLNPTADALDLESPAVGPWFDDTGITLRAPDANLAVVVTPTTALVAFPPATGLLSFAVATAERPSLLVRLRRADGAAAFTDGNLVALFTLSPEVEQRLGVLAQTIESADGNAAVAGVPSRPTVRHLAYEFTDDTADMTLLEAVVAPPITETSSASTAADKAAHVGLDVADDDVTLTNAVHPMSDLFVAGEWFGERSEMLTIGTREFTLWAFDDRGRAIDPGAVASWWNHMARTLFINLWAPGPTETQRTVAFDPQLTVHLVNAAEGALDQTLLGRVNTTALNGTGAVLTKGNGAANLLFTNAPSGADDAPVPRLAMLPNGQYGANVALYPNGPVHADLTRDYIRVGVVDVEGHLVGQARKADTGASGEASRRADDQNRATTRVAVNAVAPAGLTMHTSLDAVAIAMIGGLGANPSTLVMSALDREYGGLVAPTFPNRAPPTAPPTITARALTGGGLGGQHGRIDAQVVLLQLAFDGWDVTGSWVRVWPHGFDAETGRHVALDGGAGVTLAGGTANVIVTLPDGVSPVAGGEERSDLADAGCDVLIVTGSATATFADVRFARPEPVDGDAIALTAADQLFACEVGALTSTAALPPGFTLFSAEADGSFALVDRTSVAASGFAGSVDASITSDDVVVVTVPAFVDEESGDVHATGDLAAGTVTELGRTGLDQPFAPGLPHPTMEFYDAAVTGGAATAGVTATIAAAGGLRHHHDLSPHNLGHPGAPAAREAAGVGVTMNGAAALAVAEHTRDRANPGTGALYDASKAAPPNVNAPNAPNAWVAVLRTIGFGVDGEPELPLLIRGADSLFPRFDDAALDVAAFLENAVGALPGSFDPTGDVPRALSRRVLSSGWGLREVATSVTAAFARAEDFVYLETPAIDLLALGGDDDAIAPVQTLVDRLAARPALYAIVCLPRRSPPGWPPKLGRVRDALVREVLAAFEDKAPGRVAVFHPTSGRDRALDLVSTAVVVDDVYALTGTSHLWRRGLSFDGGLAAAVFDERLTAGRPRAVQAFRQALVARRLNANPVDMPLDPAELVGAIRGLATGAGFGRVTTGPVTVPDPVPTPPDIDIWNRDGSASADFNPFTWLADAGAQSEFVDVVP